jgi:hypothetical protein
VQLEAISGVTAPAHPAVLQLLRDLATSSGDESMCIAAIDAIATLEGAAAAGMFGEIAGGSAPLLVRAEALLALKTLGNSGPANDEYSRVAAAIGSEAPLAPLVRPSLPGKV